MADTPGVSFGYLLGRAPLSLTENNLLILAVNAPANGWVLVQFNLTCEVSYAGTRPASVAGFVDNLPVGLVPLSGDPGLFQCESVASPLLPVTRQKLFPVAKGVNNFYLRVAMRTPYGQGAVRDITMSGIYFPVTY